MTAILDILGRRQSDWETLAKSDVGYAGAFARGFVIVSKGMATFADAPTDAIRTDDATMQSYWTVSTSSMDREGDSLIPAGCLKTIENYRRNPVVLLEHNAQWPIGISIGNKGLPLIIEDGSIKAILKHHDLTDVARDTYKLVKGGIMRGASIAFLPLKAKQLGEISKGSLKSPRFLFSEWDCTHWATTTQPQNPESIRMHLSRGEIESDHFKKSLAAFAEKPLDYAHGWTPEEDAMPKTVNFRDIQSFRFAKSSFADIDAAKTFLASIGGDVSLLVDNDTSFDFTQQVGDHHGSVKLAKGVQGLLLKGKTAADVPVEKTLPIDETPDDVPPVVAKADEGKKPEVKPESKPKGPPRTTYAVQSLADVNGHIKGCMQYLQKASSMLDHEPTSSMYQGEMMGHVNAMGKTLEGHVKQHFDGADLDQIGEEMAAEKEREAETAKPKRKAIDEDADKLIKLNNMLENREKALSDFSKSIDGAKQFQESVSKRIAV